MKHFSASFSPPEILSPPARGRGLKPSCDAPALSRVSVAPRTGAWIETIRFPCTAAWWLSPPARGRGLKQGRGENQRPRAWSPPARGRGLKLALLYVSVNHFQSPPARGRGLKPFRSPGRPRMMKSPPARGRGLKLHTRHGKGRFIASPPARGRGLKLDTSKLTAGRRLVAPRTGAWIETAHHRRTHQSTYRRPPHGGVD